MGRETGYYWCKNLSGFWFVLEWRDCQWSTINGFNCTPVEINETRILSPDEQSSILDCKIEAYSKNGATYSINKPSLDQPYNE